MNDYLAIKDFNNQDKYAKVIEKKLFAYLFDMIYKPMMKMLKLKAINNTNIIIDAMEKGELIYEDGVFRAKKRFANKLSKAIISIGGKYNKYMRGYQIDKLPKQLADYIAQSSKRAELRINQINAFLDDLELNLDSVIESMVFTDDVQTILDDTGKQVNVIAKRINVIEPDLNEQQKQEIAENYTTNMQYYIKNWTQDRIIQMRTKVRKAIIDGFREDQVEDMLRTEYGIGQRKAKFLSQNETSIMLAELKKVLYTDMGFEEFVWDTITDGRERELHKQLNGKIFRFDDPPIIDERTGERGLPGETYNCRCTLRPIRRDSAFFDKNKINNDYTYYNKILEQHQNQFKDSIVKKKVYHGSSDDFEEFKEQNTYFFSDSKSVAKTYTKKAGKVHEVYLDIKNPYIYSANGQNFNKLSGKTTDELAESAKKHGYDALIINDVVDIGSNPNNKQAIEPHTDYIVFDKKQIKMV